MEYAAPQVIYEDNHLLAVVKPAGLLVQGDRSGDATLLATAKAYLKRKYAKRHNVFLGLVHRLDRPVSGVVLFARTSKAAGRLSRQFRERTVRKCYRAVVEGRPPADGGELVAFLAARGDARGVTRAAPDPFPGARQARLYYTVTAYAGPYALLSVEPVTGRRHQIRVQLALAGCPVHGDLKYGAAGPLTDRGIALHAERLEVAHPISGAELALAAPVPARWPWPPDGERRPAADSEEVRR
jgi:23S rRNA pseudouridine1911/1915/1917 synthase